MKRKRFETLASLMCIAFLGALPSIGFAEEGKWTKKADMPTPRFGLSASVVNGKIYAIGGRNEAGALSIVEEYNPRTDTWTRKADMPTEREGLATCVVDGKIYAFGGWNIKVNRIYLTTVEAYDPATDQWTTKKEMAIPRWRPAAVAVNGKVYVIIDAVVRSVRLFEHQKRTLWLLVHLFRKHTLLEIKSVAEAFNVPKFQKLLGYSYLYLWKEELSEEDLAAVALVTHVPGQLLASRKWKRLGKGFYQLAHDFFVSLVAVNELPIRREYYPLLLLASGQQQERFLRAILQEGDIYYLQYMLLANSEEVFRMSEELNVSLPRSLEENLRFLIEKGIFNPRKVAQELVAGAGVQPIVDAVGVDTLADSLDEVKTKQMLQRLLLKVDPSTLRQLLENPSLQRNVKRET